MGFFGQSRAWRATMLACSLAWFGSVSGLEAETLAAFAPDLPAKSAEPFGLSATAVVAGTLHDKWLGLQRRIDDDMVQLALCDGDRQGCVSPAALQLLAIVDAARQREGRAKLGEVNRAINLAIRSARPMYGPRRLPAFFGAPAIARITPSQNSPPFVLPALRRATCAF